MHHSISISLATLIGATFWLAGSAVIGVTIVELIPPVWAAVGVVLVIIGNAIYLRGVVAAAEQRVAALYKIALSDFTVPRQAHPSRRS